MGIKLNWTGLAMMMACSAIGLGQFLIAGAVVFLIGVVLMWMDK